MPPDLLNRDRKRGDKHGQKHRQKHRQKNGYKSFRPLQKLGVFASGLRLAVLGDRTVAFQVIVSLAVLAAAFALREWLDVLLILVVTGLVLTTEFMNTALEALSDYVQPEFDPKIGAIKDVAAAATGIAILVWLITLTVEVGRLWAVFRA